MASQTTVSKPFDIGRGLELFAVFAIAVTFLGLALARLSAFDAPPVWIGALLATLVYQRMTAGRADAKLVNAELRRRLGS